jgi:ABC-type iron transport system FetAB ATPase subunit
MKYTKDDLMRMKDSTINGVICNLSPYAKNKLMFNFNNWNDIMPLAVEHDVAYIKSERSAFSGLYIDGEYDCYYGFKLKVENDVPQRAIACCLILVLQEQ